MRLGIDFMYADPSWIYTSDIILQNSVGDFRSGFSTTNPQITANGVVTWWTPGTIFASCTINLEMFPFDTQNCSFTFCSTKYTIEYLTINPFPNPIPNFPGTVSWESLGNTMEKSITRNSFGETESVVYYVAVKRYSKTYISTCIMPNLVVSAIAVMSLYTGDSMARIGVALTALLTVVAVMVY